MSRTIAAILVLLLASFRVYAGGDSFDAEIVSLEPKGNEEYRLVMIQHSGPWIGGPESETRRITIHLRFHPATFEDNPHRLISLEKYREAIASLQTQARKGGKFRFGLMGEGLARIPGKKDEFRSNALSVLEEHDGRKVVYSFSRPI
jgi:hypothetical protein